MFLPNLDGRTSEQTDSLCGKWLTWSPTHVSTGAYNYQRPEASILLSDHVDDFPWDVIKSDMNVITYLYLITPVGLANTH